jgi:hypothetical protein
VTALGGDASPLQARRPRAHDDHPPPRAGRRLDHVRDRRLAPGRRVLDAQRIEPQVQPVDAIRSADACPDAIGLASLELADDVRVGHVRPHHPDHVDEALADRVAGGGDVRDPVRVEDRQVHPLAEAAGELERRAQRRAHAGDDVRDRLVGRDRALDDVDEVDRARPGQGRRDLQAVGLGQAAGHVFPAGHPDPDDELVADRPADRLEHFDGEAHPVRQRSAVCVAPPVDERRPELIDEVPVGFELQPVQPALPAPARRLCECRDHPPDVGLLLP